MKSIVMNASIGLVLFVLVGCNPKISTTITTTYPITDYREKVEVYDLNDILPDEFEVLGIVKVGDTGFSVNCKYDMALDKAQIEARKVGGNAIHIIEQRPPSMFGSTCHRFTANILKLNNSERKIIDNGNKKKSKNIADKYALLYVYSIGGYRTKQNFNLFIGDSLLCNIKYKQMKELKIPRQGEQKIWVSNHSNSAECIDFAFGETYYLRFNIDVQNKKYVPEINQVNSLVGYYDLNNSRFKKMKNIQDGEDVLVLKDGRHIACRVTNKDEENVYFILEKGETKIESKYSLSKVQSIQYAKNN